MSNEKETDEERDARDARRYEEQLRRARDAAKAEDEDALNKFAAGAVLGAVSARGGLRADVEDAPERERDARRHEDQQRAIDGGNAKLLLQRADWRERLEDDLSGAKTRLAAQARSRSQRAVAIEFTVTAATGLRMAPSTATAAERTMIDPVPCRVIVPALGHEQEGVIAYTLEKNAIDELVWTPVKNGARIVGGMQLWHRVIVSMAFQELVATVLGERQQSFSTKTTTSDGRSLIIDLGEV